MHYSPRRWLEILTDFILIEARLASSDFLSRRSLGFFAVFLLHCATVLQLTTPLIRLHVFVACGQCKRTFVHSVLWQSSYFCITVADY